MKVFRKLCIYVLVAFVFTVAFSAILISMRTNTANQPIQNLLAPVSEKPTELPKSIELAKSSDERPTKRAQSSGVRNYYAALTRQEKTDIRYLITTLGNKSTISLMFYKRSLNQAGERTAHIHPLKFFLFVFTDEHLKRSVKKIKGIPWRRFVEGMGGSFSSASRRDNMKEEYIEDFVNRLRIRKNLIYSSIQNRQWRIFINTVRDNLS